MNTTIAIKVTLKEYINLIEELRKKGFNINPYFIESKEGRTNYNWKSETGFYIIFYHHKEKNYVKHLLQLQLK